MILPENPAKQIRTERLILRAPDPRMARPYCEFYVRNRDHFELWSPRFADSFYSNAEQKNRALVGLRAFQDGTAWKWFLFDPSNPDEVLGFIHFSQVVRGVFQSCMLGYGIDQSAEGKGLITEAIRAGIEEVFSGRVRLHRIQANVLPSNSKSIAVLTKLQFTLEGRAPNYLFINGAWQEHYAYALINPNFKDDWLHM